MTDRSPVHTETERPCHAEVAPFGHRMTMKVKHFFEPFQSKIIEDSLCFVLRFISSCSEATKQNVDTHAR